MTTLNSCCETEAGRSLEKHRDAARCDVCGRLLLAYSVEGDFNKAVAELTTAGLTIQTGTSKGLFVISKPRAKK